MSRRWRKVQELVKALPFKTMLMDMKAAILQLQSSKERQPTVQIAAGMSEGSLIIKVRDLSHIMTAAHGFGRRLIAPSKKWMEIEVLLSFCVVYEALCF